MHSGILFSLTSCYRTARDSTQTLDDSKSMYVCVHKCVGPASQTLYARFVLGLGKCFWSVGDGVKEHYHFGRRHTE